MNNQILFNTQKSHAQTEEISDVIFNVKSTQLLSCQNIKKFLSTYQ